MAGGWCFSVPARMLSGIKGTPFLMAMHEQFLEA
jgi:hypothetical protein